MALEQDDRDWILRQITQANQYSTRAIGDTPTDALQFVPKKYLDNRFFSGQIDAAGAAVYLPTDWTSTGNGAAQTIVHNLGTTSYDVVGVAYTSNGVVNNNYATVVYDKSANSFTLQNTVNGVSNTLANFFILVKRP